MPPVLVCRSETSVSFIILFIVETSVTRSDWIFGSQSASTYEVSPPHPERTVLPESMIEKGSFVRTLAIRVLALSVFLLLSLFLSLPSSMCNDSISSSLRIIFSVYKTPVTNSSSIVGLTIAVRAWRPLTKSARGISITTS
jgi:hypothetical protein